MEDIIVIGGGGHAASVVDSIEAQGVYNVVGYTDIKKNSNLDLPYLGSDEVLGECFGMGTRNAVLGVGFKGAVDTVREYLFCKAKQIGYKFPVIVDPSAVAARGIHIGEGTFVGKNSVINVDTDIGKCCIINTGVIIEHGSEIGDFSNISVGAVLCGNVHIDQHCFIGAGSTIIQNISVAKNVIVGAGASVVRNIPECTTVAGVPAKMIYNKFKQS